MIMIAEITLMRLAALPSVLDVKVQNFCVKTFSNVSIIAGSVMVKMIAMMVQTRKTAMSLFVVQISLLVQMEDVYLRASSVIATMTALMTPMKRIVLK